MMSRFRSHLLTVLILAYCFHQALNASAYNEEKYNGRYYYQKDMGSKSRNIPESALKGKGIIGKFNKYKEEAESVRSYKKPVFKAADFESAKGDSTPKSTPPPPATPKTPAKVNPVKQNETEAEKAERIHRTFEKLLTFVEIVGQVDNYVSTKWKNLVKTVSNMYEEEDEEDYRLGLRKFKGCPAFLKEE